MQTSSVSEAPKVFGYSVFTHVVSGLFQLLVLWLSIWLWRRQGWNWFTVLSIPLFPVLLWEWWGTPSIFTFANGKLTARSFWGRERTWRVDELTIPGAGSIWTLAGLGGYSRVLDRNGEHAFNVSAYLDDFDEFVELIEPGSKAKREARDPNSWWNRELFK